MNRSLRLLQNLQLLDVLVEVNKLWIPDENFVLQIPSVSVPAKYQTVASVSVIVLEMVVKKVEDERQELYVPGKIGLICFIRELEKKQSSTKYPAVYKCPIWDDVCM